MREKKYTKEQINSKINKLIALAENEAASEGEVANAMAKVQKLMMEYHISEMEIGKEKPNKKEVHIKTVDIPRSTIWCNKSLAVIVAENFRCFCYTVTRLKEVNIVGFENDVDIVMGILRMASNKMFACLKAHMRKSKENKTSDIKNAFLNGFLEGIRAKLNDQTRKEGWQLVVTTPKAVQDVKQSMGLIQRNSRIKIDPTKESARQAGYRDGKSTELVRSIAE